MIIILGRVKKSTYRNPLSKFRKLCSRKLCIKGNLTSMDAGASDSVGAASGRVKFLSGLQDHCVRLILVDQHASPLLKVPLLQSKEGNEFIEARVSKSSNTV